MIRTDEESEARRPPTDAERLISALHSIDSALDGHRMSLRDEFAAAAVTGSGFIHAADLRTATELARRAYEIADAMLDRKFGAAGDRIDLPIRQARDETFSPQWMIQRSPSNAR